jgi:hypothetical protein
VIRLTYSSKSRRIAPLPTRIPTSRNISALGYFRFYVLQSRGEIQMRFSASANLLSAAAALALLTGCSSGSAIAPTSSTMQSHHFLAMSGRIPSVLNPVGMLKLRQLGTPDRTASFNACPASGPIVYMSDFNTSTINIYKVPFAGQAPCGRLTHLKNPQGMIVRHNDLFVANTEALNVVAFHRGATRPYIKYTDPSCSGQFPADVTVSNDNFVFATNIISGSCAGGSISIWQKQSGALVGNIPNQAGANSYFLTIQKDGTLYYDDNTFALYKGSCAGGACGAFTNTGATFAFPGGLRSADGEDVVLDDQSASGGGALFTYEPPDFSSPDVCTIGGADPVSFDINHRQHRAFVADAGLNEALELSYPGCKLIGTVPGNTSGLPIGMAKDQPETLH